MGSYSARDNINSTPTYALILCGNYSNNTNGSDANCTDGDASVVMAGRGPERFLVPMVFGLIFIVGVVGNSTLIWIVGRNKAMRNVPNVYIVSLALGDLLLIIVSVPFNATLYTFWEWPYGEAMCKTNEFLQSLSLGVSVFTLTALGGDRYMAIVDPMGKRSRPGLSATLVTASAIWALALLLALPDAVGAHIRVTEFTHYSLELCKLYPLSWPPWYPKFHVVARFLIYFAIPVAIIAIFYVLMAMVLMRSSRLNVLSEGQASKHQKQLEARKKVAVVVLSFVLVFVLCWLPRHIYTLWYHFDPSNYNLFWHVFKILGFCLSFINSCVNPVALYFLSKQFRKYYDVYLFCCCTGGRDKPQRPNHPDYASIYKFSNSKTSRTSLTRLTGPSHLQFHLTATHNKGSTSNSDLESLNL